VLVDLESVLRWTWSLENNLPFPVTAPKKASVCSSSLVGIAGSSPTGGMNVCCQRRVLSRRGLCDELITRPGES